MATYSWAQVVIAMFPSLASEDFEIVEGTSGRYNCIAYAAGYANDWWWPDGINYWPPWATLTDRMESLIEVFAGLGYEQCDDSRAEADYRKIALYEAQGEMKHVALQMPNGAWRSKMGQGPVIEHRNPESLAGGDYGDPTVFMRKSIGANP